MAGRSGGKEPDSRGGKHGEAEYGQQQGWTFAGDRRTLAGQCIARLADPVGAPLLGWPAQLRRQSDVLDLATNRTLLSKQRRDGQDEWRVELAHLGHQRPGGRLASDRFSSAVEIDPQHAERPAR